LSTSTVQLEVFVRFLPTNPNHNSKMTCTCVCSTEYPSRPHYYCCLTLLWHNNTVIFTYLAACGQHYYWHCTVCEMVWCPSVRLSISLFICLPAWVTAANFSAVAQLAGDVDQFLHDAQQRGGHAMSSAYVVAEHRLVSCNSYVVSCWYASAVTSDSGFWQVCRQFLRGSCNRKEEECRFAHPPKNADVNHDNTVTACIDFIKGRCKREPCRYFHPPSHLKPRVYIDMGAVCTCHGMQLVCLTENRGYCCNDGK